MPSPQSPARNSNRKSPPARARSQSPAHPSASPPASDMPQATANLPQRETAAPPPSAARTAAANTPPQSSSHAHSATMHAARMQEILGTFLTLFQQRPSDKGRPDSHFSIRRAGQPSFYIYVCLYW